MNIQNGRRMNVLAFQVLTLKNQFLITLSIIFKTFFEGRLHNSHVEQIGIQLLV